jgi:hypothetical protein
MLLEQFEAEHENRTEKIIIEIKMFDTGTRKIEIIMEAGD